MWDTLLNNLPLAIVLIIAAIICGADLIKAISVWRAERKKKIDKGFTDMQKELDVQRSFEDIKDTLKSLDQKIEGLNTRMDSAEKRLQDLTISDMHDIKSWIVEQYHKFYTNQGWIDAFNAETIDRRYEDYKREGGNSYITTLMERIHTLPMDPDREKKDN